jgi:hypothetical protein
MQTPEKQKDIITSCGDPRAEAIETPTIFKYLKQQL